LPIDDSFPDDLFSLAVSGAPLFADLVNYLACEMVPPDMNSHQRKRFFSQAQAIFLGGTLFTQGMWGWDYSAMRAPKRKLLPLFAIATTSLMADMQVMIKLPPRSFKLVLLAYSIQGCPCLCSGLRLLSKDRRLVKEERMPFNYILEVEIFDV